MKDWNIYKFIEANHWISILAFEIWDWEPLFFFGFVNIGGGWKVQIYTYWISRICVKRIKSDWKVIETIYLKPWVAPKGAFLSITNTVCLFWSNLTFFVFLYNYVYLDTFKEFWDHRKCVHPPITLYYQHFENFLFYLLLRWENLMN